MTRGAFVSFAQPPSAPVFRADGTVALFLHRRQAEHSAGSRTTSPFVGNGAKQLRGNDRSLSGFGINALLFGRVRDRATIRDAWCSDMAVGGEQYNAEDLDAPAVVCLCYEALCQWHVGEIASCHPTMEEAISLAKELNETDSLAVALHFAAFLARYERNPAEAERLASDLIELSTAQNFAYWLACGAVSRGWARSASGDTAQGIPWMDDGIRTIGQPARFWSRRVGSS